MLIKLTNVLGIIASVCISFTNAENSSPIWSFTTDGSISSMDTIGDCSDPKNGGNDLVIGTSFDSLYLLEAKSGSGQNIQGEPLWIFPFLSTINVIKSVPDMNNDGRPDIAIGDQNGVTALFSGGSGTLFWIYIANTATILSIDKIPDINNDGVPEIIAGAENDTVYCLSGLVPNMWDPNPQPRETVPLWVFNTNPPGLHKKSVNDGQGGRNKGMTGANSVAAIYHNSSIYGIAVGASSNAVFCLSPTATNGVPAVKWKYITGGDVWSVKAFPDVNGDGIEEVLAASGDDKGYLLNGKDGSVLWTRSVDSGATVVDVIGDQNGDGFSDALIGDGSGKIHCISGKVTGENVAPLWVYSTHDNQTVTSLSHIKDVNGDGKEDCIFGSTNDSVYVVSASGAKIWSAYMDGTVMAVSAIKDVNGDGFDEVAAASDGSICTVFKGQGAAVNSIADKHLQFKDMSNLKVSTSQKTITATFFTDQKSTLSFELVDTKGRRVFASEKITYDSGIHTFAKEPKINPGSYVFILNGLHKKTLERIQFF